MNITSELVSPGGFGADSDLNVKTIPKIQRRLLPFIFICYNIALLDRVNIGFAGLTMNKELAISAQQFGLLAGIFYIGYVLFEIPSNMLMHKLGARIWIARVLISWGLVAACTGFARSATHIYIIRFVLGLAEAGFYPGMILYCTYWFRQRERAQAVAFFMLAQPFSALIGAPISGLILDHIHWFGISSWRWLLVLEAAPAIILGVITLFVLPSRPKDAQFLSSNEKDWLEGELKREEQETLADKGHDSALAAIKSGKVWFLGFIYFVFLIGVNWMNFFLPQVVKALSKFYSNSTVGFLIMIPMALGMVAMVVISRHSDRTGERRLHTGLPAVIGGIALLIIFAFKVSNPVWSIILLCFMTIGIDNFFGPFWAVSSSSLTGYAAAAGIAFISSLGNIGGFVGPALVGYVQNRTHTIYAGAAIAGLSLLGAGLLVIFFTSRPRASD
ncbi:MAG: MFS transporter [Candidatus Korobacteraceae bacterium]|jgi:sugar phosphate permease